MYKIVVQMDLRHLYKSIHTEEKMGSSLVCMVTGEYSLNIKPVTQTLRATIKKWALLKLRNFCKAKGHNHQDQKGAYSMGKDLY